MKFPLGAILGSNLNQVPGGLPPKYQKGLDRIWSQTTQSEKISEKQLLMMSVGQKICLVKFHQCLAIMLLTLLICHTGLK